MVGADEGPNRRRGRTIAVGSDHAGFAAKESVKALLKKKGYTVVDVGTGSDESCDYPDYAAKVARAVASGRAGRGVLVCGTGIGMCMTANKFRGVRAALVTDEFTAEMSRRHNDANVFCTGARVLPASRIRALLARWLDTEFESGGRHERRVDKIDRMDGRARRRRQG
jgi:ribose 5-phosphate isomerase B